VARTELVDELAAAISAPAGWQAADGNLNLISACPRRLGQVGVGHSGQVFKAKHTGRRPVCSRVTSCGGTSLPDQPVWPPPDPQCSRRGHAAKGRVGRSRCRR
jgi:hypothetical protein